MGITYERFMEIAREMRAMSILECYDKQAFDFENKIFGPITEEYAYAQCGYIEAIHREELAAAKYFGK